MRGRANDLVPYYELHQSQHSQPKTMPKFAAQALLDCGLAEVVKKGKAIQLKTAREYEYRGVSCKPGVSVLLRYVFGTGDAESPMREDAAAHAIIDSWPRAVCQRASA